MTDIPKVTPVKLSGKARDMISAAQAVRDGIATHAETHRAAMQKARAKREEDRKLQAGVR